MSKTDLIPAKNDPKCRKKFNANFDGIFKSSDKPNQDKPKFKMKVNGVVVK